MKKLPRKVELVRNQDKPVRIEDPIQSEDLWSRRGIEDIYFQRENLVNFWTVMGGIAAGALLTQLGSLELNLSSSRWYLVFFFISSILTIVNSWVQSAWGSLVLRWRMTIPGMLIYFLLLFSLCVQCLLITRPSGWMAASTALVAFSILNQFYFRNSGAWSAFSKETVARFKNGILMYFIFFLITLIGTIQLIWLPFHLDELLWGLIALSTSILALFVQHKGMEQEKKELGIP